jgi:hypothetical protein
MAKNKKEAWEIEYNKKVIARNKGMKNLTNEQKTAINELYDITNDVIVDIGECFDIRLEDIRKLDNAKWKVFHAFNMENRKKE